MARLTHVRFLAPALVLGLSATGCPDRQHDAPLPAESYEIASAAPGALGALAGGTDAAPGAPLSDPDLLDPDDTGDEPGPTDGGVPEVQPPAAEPENVPL